MTYPGIEPNRRNSEF